MGAKESLGSPKSAWPVAVNAPSQGSRGLSPGGRDAPPHRPPGPWVIPGAPGQHGKWPGLWSSPELGAGHGQACLSVGDLLGRTMVTATLGTPLAAIIPTCQSSALWEDTPHCLPSYILQSPRPWMFPKGQGQASAFQPEGHTRTRDQAAGHPEPVLWPQAHSGVWGACAVEAP